MEFIVPLLFIPLFLLLWVAVTSLMAIIGGWYGLAKSYPMPKVLYEKGQRYTFQSIRIGFFGNYNTSVNITVYNQGISIAPLYIYSVLHKPIYIDYNSMTNAVFGRFIFNYLSFTLGNRKIKIWGKSVIKIKEIIERNTQR